MTDPIALSFSRLSDYEQCPLKFKAKYITKTYPDDSDNPAFVKGNLIHGQLEDYINNLKNGEEPGAMNTHVKNMVPMIDKLFKQCNGNIYPEKQIAVNHKWEKCGWYDKPDVVKYRAIIDMMAFLTPTHLLLGDFKSGKVREYEDGPTTQLKLTTTMGFHLFPKVEKITCAYFFVEHKKTVKVEFTRDHLDDLQKPFDESYILVNETEDFKPNKNRYCHWCLLTAEDCPVKA